MGIQTVQIACFALDLEKDCILLVFHASIANFQDQICKCHLVYPFQRIHQTGIFFRSNILGLIYIWGMEYLHSLPNYAKLQQKIHMQRYRQNVFNFHLDVLRKDILYCLLRQCLNQCVPRYPYRQIPPFSTSNRTSFIIPSFRYGCLSKPVYENDRELFNFVGFVYFSFIFTFPRKEKYSTSEYVLYKFLIFKQMLRKGTNLTLIFLFVLHFTTIFSYCQGSFRGSYETCTFKYGYVDLNCTIFRFDDCQWDQCVEYVTVGNDTSCNQYQTFSDSNWPSCSNRCCNEEFPLAYSSFQQCEDTVKSKVIKIGIIIGSIFGGIIVIIAVTCIICRCKSQISSCCSSIGGCCRTMAQGLCFILTCGCIRQMMNRNTTNNDQSEQKKEETIEDFARWTQDMKYNDRLNQSCCICLEPGPTLQLQCGHIYHRACILACIDKKQQCVLCRAVNIDKVKAYCEKCSLKYYETNLHGHRQSLRKNQQICQNCKQYNL